MYHWIYLTPTEYDGVVKPEMKTYTAPAVNVQAMPEVGDEIVFCEKVPAIYDEGREASFEVTAITWYSSPNGGAPCGVRWTAALA